MRLNFLLRSLAASTLTFFGLVSTSLAALDISNPQIVEAFVDGAVTGTMDASHSPSGVVLVVKDGQVILSKGYGYQDVDKGIPVDAADTLFRPGSISKLFTWVSVLQLVEQGKLNLDEDVNSYLTQFQIPDVWPDQPVTLRHIMTHTAGFEDGGLGYLIIEDPERIVPLAESLEYYMPERVRPPGQYMAYSNWATALAGLIVANTSGMNFNAYVQQHIFDVLGMTHASFLEPLPSKLDALMAKRYRFSGGRYVEQPYEIISNYGPAGALAASAGAMAKFGEALLNGGAIGEQRILQPSSASLLLDPQFSHDPRIRGIALGGMIYNYNGIDVSGHGGATLSYISHFGLSREENTLFFFSFSGPGARAVRGQLLAPFYNAFFHPDQAPRPTDAAPSQDLERFAGEYHSRRSSYTKIEAIARLARPLQVAVTDAGTLRIGDREYMQEDERLFREIGGQRRYAFQEDETGNIVGLSADGRSVAHLYRPPFYERSSLLTPLLAVSFLVFVGVFLRTGYQWQTVRALRSEERAAVNASLFVAITNWAFALSLGYMLITEQDNLASTLPAYMPVIFLFPAAAVAAALYHAYHSYRLWRMGYCGNAWTRARYSVITLCALFTAWFYFHWNFVGFNYLY
ncbi:MAG: serine hydrolase domain-containing protein [Pseudomonadota bacterium]